MPSPPFESEQIVQDITKAFDFIFRYRRSSYPFVLNTATMNRIHFHNPDSKVLPYPLESGSAYIQAFLAKIVYQIFEVTKIPNHRDRAGDLINALCFYFYSQYIPNNTFDGYWLPNEYVAANDQINITTQGSQTNNTPFNYGFFDVSVVFSSGRCNLPSDLAFVYDVYDLSNKLLIQNVHSPTLLGNINEIDYFVVNYNLKGVNYRIYPNLSMVLTTETAGLLKLKSGLNSSLRITYIRYNGASVARTTGSNNSQGFLGINPVWFSDPSSIYFHSRSIFAVYDAFKKAGEILNSELYIRASEHTKKSFINLLKVLENKTFLYKKEGYPNALRYPGSNAEAVLSMIETSGLYIDYLKLQGNTIHFYNNLVQVVWGKDTKLEINISSNTDQIVDIYCLTSPNIIPDISRGYKAKLLLDKNPNTIKFQFGIEDFRRFVNGYHYLASDSNLLPTEIKFDGSVTQSLKQIEAYYSSTLANSITMRKSLTRDESRILLSKKIEFPFNIRYSSSKPLRIRVKDNKNIYWYGEIPKTNRIYYSFNNVIRDKVFETVEINNDIFYSKSPAFVYLFPRTSLNLNSNFSYCGSGKFSTTDDFGLVFYDSVSTGEVRIVFFQKNIVSRVGSAGFFLNRDFDFLDIADFDGDKLDEILFISNNRRANEYRAIIRDLNTDGTSKLDNFLPIQGTSPSTNGGWILKGSVKVRANNSDLLWYNFNEKRYAIWRVNNNQHTLGDNYSLFTDSIPYPDQLYNEWILKDIKDFNGDGIDDLFFISERTDNRGGIVLNKPRLITLKYSGNNASLDNFFYYPDMPVIESGWKYEFSANLNNEAYLDLFWRNLSTNQILIWFLDEDLSIQDSLYLSSVSFEFSVLAVSDLNKDGFNDILWYSQTEQKFYVWYLDGLTKLFQDISITELALEPLDLGDTEIFLDYIGNPPETLHTDSKTYVHGVKESINISHFLWVGDFFVLDNNLIDNSYYQSCLPDHVQIKNNTVKIYSGVVSLRNQSPFHCRLFNLNSAYVGQSNLIIDSFNHYFSDHGFNAGFTPNLINTSSWDNADFARYGSPVRTLNIKKSAFPIPFLFHIIQTQLVIFFTVSDQAFVWSVEDSQSAYNQYKVLESIAKDLYLNNSNNTKFKNILSTFINDILQGLSSNNNFPFTTYFRIDPPTADYLDVGLLGVIGKIALYSNLYELEVDSSLEIVRICYNALRSQFIESGVMSGTWSNAASSFSVNSVAFKQYNIEDHCEIIDFLSLCHKYKDSLNFPYESAQGVFPKIPITRINSISYPSFEGNRLVSDDGSVQTHIKQLPNIGLEIEIYYERLDDTALSVLSEFWQLIGGLNGTFTLPDQYQFEDFRNNGEKFRFMTSPKFDVFIANPRIGLYNCTVRIQSI